MLVNPPRIAFCSTCKGRSQHLFQTIPKNLKDNSSYANAVFVVVDYGGQDELAGKMAKMHPEEMESGRLVVYTYPSTHRSSLRNA